MDATRPQPESESGLARRGEWHVLLRGLQRGPYSLAALRQLLAESEEGGAALVWRAGMRDWTPAHQLDLFTREPRVETSGRDTSALAPSFQQATMSVRPSGRATSRAAGETTLELPAYRALSGRAVWLRWMALVSLVSIAAVGAYVVTLHRQGARRQPPPPPPLLVQRVPALRVPAPPLPPAPSSLGQPAPAIAVAAALPAVPVASSRLTTTLGAEPRGQEEGLERSPHLRVRSGWAPIRAAASADAQVLCSLARGTQLEAAAQQPGHRGRWFEVDCDSHKRGWIHENHVRARRQAGR